jgi:hypothetical protein
VNKDKGKAVAKPTEKGKAPAKAVSKQKEPTSSQETIHISSDDDTTQTFKQRKKDIAKSTDGDGDDKPSKGKKVARFRSLYTDDEGDHDNDEHNINPGKGKKQKPATRGTQNARKGRYKSKAVIDDDDDDSVVEIPEVSGKRKADQSLTDEEDAGGKYIYTSLPINANNHMYRFET